MARFVAHRLRSLGAAETMPDEAGGRERRFAGGIGDKKVDVSLASPEHGLILSVGIKSINFADGRSGTYAKNLTNRRGDLLAEATTLHQRFPYAVVGGLFLFEAGAAEDGTSRRLSTVQTAHQLFKSFAARPTRSDAVEQYEALAIALYRGLEPFDFRVFDAGEPDRETSLDAFLGRLLEIVAQRNPDRFRFFEGSLHGASQRARASGVGVYADAVDQEEEDPDPSADEAADE